MARKKIKKREYNDSRVNSRDPLSILANKNFIQDAFEYWKEKKDEKREYLDSKEFTELIEVIKGHDSVYDQHLLYKVQEIEGLPIKKFNKVVESVFECLSDKVVRDPESTTFPRYYVDYEGIRFNVLFGQGASYWTTKLEI